MGQIQIAQATPISIHALREEGDLLRCVIVLSSHISIHALREEGDACVPCVNGGVPYFYPRPPRGGRPALCGVRPPRRYISIHALREEGDHKAE